MPGNIVFVPVDGSGYATVPGTPGARVERFITGTEPRLSPSKASDVSSPP